MPTSSRKRGVRFDLDEEQQQQRQRQRQPSTSVIRDDGDHNNNGGGGGDDSGAVPQRRKKRPRKERPNEDEMDDVDDWKPEDDYDGATGGAGDDGLPSERDLLEAKRKRRLKREHVDGGGDDGMDDDDDDNENAEETTHIDASTSLATEGVAIEPFSMQNETEDGTGYFDGDTYVFRREDKEEPDAWLDSLNEDDKNKKKEYYEEESEEGADEKTGNSDDGGGGESFDTWTQDELYGKLLPLVSDTETVAQAIVRYGNILKRNATKTTGGSRHSSSSNHSKTSSTTTATTSDKNEDDGNNNKVAAELAQKSLNEVTEAANALLLKGQVDIYQKTRNDLLKLLPPGTDSKTAVEGVHQFNQVAAAAGAGAVPVQWEYQGSQDQQIHGPYKTEDMLSWIRAGYFIGPSAVKVRTIQEEEEKEDKKSMQDDLLSDLMDDDDNAGNDGNDKKQPASSSEKKKKKKKLVYGDWFMSDQVDFSKYLAKK